MSSTPTTKAPGVSDADTLATTGRRAQHPGFLKLSITYEAEHSAIVILVMEGRELRCPGKGRGDVYVKTYMIPDPKKTTKRKVSVKAKQTDPSWREEIRYPISSLEEAGDQILQISTWDKSRKVLMGRTTLKVAEFLPPKGGLIGWFELYTLPQGNSVFKMPVVDKPTEAYIALYDYEPRGPQELLLRKDDLVCVVKDDEEWVLVKNLITLMCGMVPKTFLAPNMSLTAEAWFFGPISRQKAEKLLGNPLRKHGCYLIRESESQPGQYSLSMKDGESVRHYRIITDAAGHFQLQGSSSPMFRALRELVEFHKDKKAGLTTVLKDVCPKEQQARAADLSYEVKDKWEVPRESIELIKVLGHGQYGEVYSGKWGGTIDVAVKTLKDKTATVAEFLEEAQIMKKLKHDHLIQLYAVCTIGEPIFIITELMVNGSLLDYLHSEAGEELRLPDLLDMSAEVASGMAYLEANNFIHRDLAARNILVGENHICKVADFGFARLVNNSETYKQEGQNKFPVRWTAPEAMSKNQYSIKSDVWSFGVFMIELVTYGGKPYDGMSNKEVVEALEKDYRMPCPPGCPPNLHAIMLECWRNDPADRPTFESLQFRLEDFFHSEVANYTDVQKLLEEQGGGND
eukprot:m.616871 g.616871  ORF g.616871 m.616871 type:complete len:629 (-) comp58172_c0_seq7:292-2178(-)